MWCFLFCSINTEQRKPFVGDRQSDIRQAQQTQSTDKPETIATDEDTGERSREFKLELPLSQTNPRGSALFSFLIETDPYILVPLRLSLMYLNDKILFQPNFRKVCELGNIQEVLGLGMLVCLFLFFLCQMLLVWFQENQINFYS